MKRFAHLLLACTAVASLSAQSETEPLPLGPPAPPPEAPAPPPEEPRDAARREAWTSAVLIFSMLEQGDNRAFPGIRAWLDDFREVAATTPPPETGKPFPFVAADALVTRNPDFWAAFYEVQPGDAGLALLHAALLLSGGEAQRAAVIAALGLQRTAPEEIKRGLRSIIAHCVSAQSHSMDLVRLGVRLHEMGEYEAAVKQFDLALREWPANGCAHYERGSALRLQVIAAARRAGTFREDAEEPIPDPAETLAAFGRARRHDPLHLLAYQGEDEGLKAALLALVNSGLPVWESIRRKPEQAVRTDALRTFSEACRAAAVDEFALVARQLVVAGNRHYAPDDAELVKVCLNRIAPAALTPPLLARVHGEVRLPARQIVVPQAVDPPELTRDDPAAKKNETVANSKPSTSTKKVSSASAKKKRVAAASGKRPAKSKGKSGKKRKS